MKWSEELNPFKDAISYELSVCEILLDIVTNIV